MLVLNGRKKGFTNRLDRYQSCVSSVKLQGTVGLSQ